MPPTKRRREKAPPNPTTIQSKWFTKKSPLNLNDLENIRADSPEDSFDVLFGDRWNGGIVSYLTVDISQNNQTPIGSNFYLKGPIFQDKEKLFKSPKFFTIDEQFYLAFSNLDCSIFEFHNGLVSNYVDSTEISFELRKEKHSESFEPEDLTGYPGFSLRAFASPVEANWARLSILLYPADVDSLLELCDAASSPWWPGIPIFSELIPLGPSPGDFFTGPSRGLAVVPALISAAGFTEASRPTTTAILGSVSATLRAVSTPETKTNVTQLHPRWNSIKAEGESALKSSIPDLLWPEPEFPMTAPQGRHHPLYYPFFLISCLLNPFCLSFSI